MIRCRLRQPVSQETLQTQRVCASPCDPSLRIDAFEIPDQQHPKVHSRCDARPTHCFALIETKALSLRKLIKAGSVQNLIYPVVKNVAAASWQLVGRDP